MVKCAVNCDGVGVCSDDGGGGMMVGVCDERMAYGILNNGGFDLLLVYSCLCVLLCRLSYCTCISHFKFTKWLQIAGSLSIA